MPIDPFQRNFAQQQFASYHEAKMEVHVEKVTSNRSSTTQRCDAKARALWLSSYSTSPAVKCVRHHANGIISINVVSHSHARAWYAHVIIFQFRLAQRSCTWGGQIFRQNGTRSSFCFSRKAELDTTKYTHTHMDIPLHPFCFTLANKCI